jgi:hypothetical protein
MPPLQIRLGAWGYAVLSAGPDAIAILSGDSVNKALWICCLVGAALGISLGLALFHDPFWGAFLGLGAGAVVGASIQRRH